MAEKKTAPGEASLARGQGNETSEQRRPHLGETNDASIIEAKADPVQPKSDRLAAALRYAALGWRVFPIVAKGKRPAGLLVPNGLKDATTDADTIRKWWAAYPQANIGGTPPEGTYVLDLDTYRPGADLDALAARLAALHTPLQRSGGGGVHFVLRGPAPSQAALRKRWGAGIDVKASGKGYAMLAPSVHPETGALYEWGKSPAIAPANSPAWLVEGATTPVPIEDDGSRKSGFIETSPAPLSHHKPADLRESRALLDKLPHWRDDYAEWLRVGMALHHEFGGHPEALALWDEWSQPSSKYDADACAAKWTTFGKGSGTPVTLGSLVYAADTQAATVADGPIRLHHSLGSPPSAPEYMLRSPVWLPDVPEQVMFYGKSDTFKSVAVQGLCVHLAAGVGLDGERTAPRVVVYCAEEAPLLFDNNMHGWDLHFATKLRGDAREHARANLQRGYMQRVAGSLEGLSVARAKELAGAVRKLQRKLNSTARPVVVLDPAAEVMLGDENKTTDMRAFISAGRVLQRECGALVVLVHHEGHGDTGRERGSSTLPAAMYARYQVRRPTPDAYSFELHTRKHKGGAPRTPSRWDVHIVPLMPEAEQAPDAPLTGVVLVHAGEAAPVLTREEVQATTDDHAIAAMCAAYRRSPTIGRPGLLEALGCGASRADRLRAEAVARGLLAAGGGSGRAGYALTDAGRALADTTIADEEDDLLAGP